MTVTRTEQDDQNVKNRLIIERVTEGGRRAQGEKSEFRSKVCQKS